MCVGYYLGCRSPLHPVPWFEERPAFHVDPLSDDEHPVRAQFSLPHVYYLGAHTHCSCGFTSSDEPDPASQDQSLGALIAFLKWVGAAGATQLFVCWDGDYAKVPQHVLEFAPAELSRRAQWLADRSFDGEPSFVHLSRAAA